MCPNCSEGLGTLRKYWRKTTEARNAEVLNEDFSRKTKERLDMKRGEKRTDSGVIC